jgi:hypothetical protein
VDEKLCSPAISAEEIQAVISEINAWLPGAIVFTGGEPTLFVNEINSIVEGIDGLKEVRVTLITNGHFSTTAEEAAKMLRSFRRLTGVQLSYDKFHAEFLPEDRGAKLLNACREMGLSFGILCAIEEPADLLILNKPEFIGVPVTVQKVLPGGAAGDAGVSYRYSVFDENVLDKKCPNKGNIVYNCGAGFTTCCGLLASAGDRKKYVHPGIKEHRSSAFYKLVSENNFGDLLKRAGVRKQDLLPEHSAPCVLCSYLVPRVLSGGFAG